MMVAIYTIGCLVGALACPQFGNRFGRRWTLVGSAVITTVGQVLQSSSFSLTRLIIGHIVSGIGVGNINSIVPVWQSECSPKNRGNNVVILGTFVATVKVCGGCGTSPILATDISQLWRRGLTTVLD